MFSDEQLVYFKDYILLKNSGDDVARISSSLFDSKIALNPHQINAAVSFFHNPKRKGMLFADEVGLGKTIEAGLVISQYWYEQKRKIIIICPASLIKQWNDELLDKFHLESVILDGKTIKDPAFRWEKQVYITSVHTVYLNKELFGTKFDLVVIDEAHKLRNVYKDKGLMAPAIKEVFSGQKKLLLTATPFQNNLQELYGLMSLLDEDLFPDINVFKEKYIKNYSDNKAELNNILSKYIVRTLRKDVTKYINYTKRNVLLANYELTDKELEIYKRVEELIYSQDMADVYGTGQLHLIIILLQKLLSSSVFAVRSTLYNIMFKLQGEVQDLDSDCDLEIVFNGKITDSFIGEINECISYIDSVGIDSKINRLKISLIDLFNEFDKDENRNRKILIFTESKKTQEYLYNELKDTYNKILLFNGENTGDEVNKIYIAWNEKHNIGNRINKSVAIRKAIVDAFENDYDILIATDAAAEGLNLQFCSVIINYDLPWNPQKIEQRIGRCHRYGQKNDVIVINMLNDSSNIDKRIYELLNSKLGIFDETFGSSDKILGSNNISDDIEDAIKKIYKTCRTPQDIEAGFSALQEQFREEINAAIKNSETDLDTYFDEEVAQAFDHQFVEATRLVNEMTELFYYIIKSRLPEAEFFDDRMSFNYHGVLKTVVANYDDNAEFCSISSDFGKSILDDIMTLDDTKRSKIIFDYSNSNKKIGYIDDLSVRSGKFIVSKIIYDSFEISEALVISGLLDDNTVIPSEICHKLLKLNVLDDISLGTDDFSQLSEQHDIDVKSKINDISLYNTSLFQEEMDYIDNWADSLIEKVQFSVQSMREERKELQKQCDYTNSIDEKMFIQEKIQKLSQKINKSWLELAQMEDDIEVRRAELIKNLNAEKDKSISVRKLFELEWSIQ